MTTLGELRTLARAELDDAAVTPLWSDERLTAWLREAVRAYGRALPRRTTVELASVAGQASYALPADVVWVAAVEYPASVPLVLARGDGPADRGAYRVVGSELLLEPAPARASESIRVRYAALYPEPATDTDVLATPPSDDHLLVLAAAGRALRWLALTDARSLRVSGGRTSALDLATAYDRAYAEAISARRRAVRTGRLAALGP